MLRAKTLLRLQNGPRIAGRMVYKAVKFRKILPAMPHLIVLLTSVRLHRAIRIWLAGLSIASALAAILGSGAAVAQTPARPAVEAAPQAVPGFWDPRRRPDRPDMSRLAVIRFLTETDYPPFNFTGPDGNPAGFNVDLARSLCDEIKVTCTIQMRRFETLVDAITSNRGDAIIASLAVTPALRARLDFTDPYYRAPARFVSRRDAVMPEVRPEYLEGKKVGVIAGTSHEAYLKAMFTDAELKPYANDDALRLALRRSEVDFIFGDAIALAFWVNGTDSGECCAFSGGPFVESRYFGEGIGIAVRKGNDLLRKSLNWALFRIWEKGRFTDLWLRYFSISPFYGDSVIPGQRSEPAQSTSRDSRVRLLSHSHPGMTTYPRHFAFRLGSASFRGPGESISRCPRSTLPLARAICVRSPNNPTPGRSSRPRPLSRG